MTTYRVTWVIDMDAGTHEEAARLALAVQRDPESTATVFEVVAFNDPKQQPVRVDVQ